MLATHSSYSPLDLNILSLLTQDAPLTPLPSRPTPHASRKVADRRPVGTQDPLMAAAAASAGPDVTRAHYFHSFFPQELAYASRDGELPPGATAPALRPQMQSRQAPRRTRLEAEAKSIVVPVVAGGATSPTPTPTPTPTSGSVVLPQPKASTLPSAFAEPTVLPKPLASVATPLFASGVAIAAAAALRLATLLPPLEIRCQVRTRIPTPHGHVFLHLYTNNHDKKEHLAFVADRSQTDTRPSDDASEDFLRSRSLDAEWREGESVMERIVRGAYVGRLSPEEMVPSVPFTSGSRTSVSSSREAPLVRIHSECFTGEVIGSQRCDCGEQLDEAFRLITTAGRGVIVYLRQEGRGIGLMEKMRAYNLQDLGHDTVAANELLGHGADLRTYDIAGAILKDLGVHDVRLLTNNPDKISKITDEGIRVVERVAMVPRSWVAPSRRKTSSGGKRTERRRRPVMSGTALLTLATDQLLSSPSSSSTPSAETDSDGDGDASDDDDGSSAASDSSDDAAAHNLRRAGVGMIGASTTRSTELDKYLRTKVERMGHLLAVPSAPVMSPVLRSERKARRAAQESLASSVGSLLTDEGSVGCGSGCEVCTDGSNSAIEYAPETLDV